MNCKGGIYSLTIGAMAIALLTLMVFSTQAILFEEESEDFLSVMSEVRIIWQNTMLVFDSVVEDSANDIGCGIIQADIESRLDNAINAINNALEPGVQCSYSTVSFSVAGNTVTFEANISCERRLIAGNVKKFTAKYSKNVIFVKNCS